ncbi:hypothetical protein G7046_g1352 [Stylonectria norvegica]|nr:hypothetical protein G7046_g1352 [Stylonectria norvegica]
MEKSCAVPEQLQTDTESIDVFQQPPLPSTTTSMSNRFTNHLSDDVRPSIFAELQLLILTFCTGMQGQCCGLIYHKKLDVNIPLDATTFPDYHCFASNQTGNTVFLCLALILPRLNGEMFITANIGMALGLFLGAGWLTGQLSHMIGPRRRWWLVFCNLVQTCLVFGAAAVQYRYGVTLEGPTALAVIGLLAFAAGSQVVQSRSLAMTEISTAMATAAWVDLLIDKRLFEVENRPRTRRVAFLLSLVAGSLVGAYIYREVGSPTVLAVSGAGKLLVAILYFFTNAEKKQKDTSAV